jgi:capsular polysaccharide biosynthesis protein
MHTQFSQPLSEQIRVVQNARFIPYAPEAKRRAQVPFGLYDQAGQTVEQAQCWRSPTAAASVFPTQDASSTKIEKTQSGRWLFGGILYAHFGHFLCESTSRLWALDAERLKDRNIDGVVFINKRKKTWPHRFAKPTLPWFKALGVDANILSVNEPTIFEELVVAPQGFGTGAMMSGASEFRHFARRNFGKDIAAKGASKIYISRSQLFAKRGRYLGERALENHLAAEGFSIFHPQQHSIEEQIAQYKAAKVIVSSDNSALHLAAFFGDGDTQTVIIRRRAAALIADFNLQYENFSALKPAVIDVLRPDRMSSASEGNRFLNEVYTELDFLALQKNLFAQGIISSDVPWGGPTDEEIEMEKNELAERNGVETLFRMTTN